MTVPILVNPNDPPPEPKLLIAHFALPEEFKGYYADAEPQDNQ
jgi:hypothetical protein